MIFKKIGNMENVEAICHYYLIAATASFLEGSSMEMDVQSYLIGHLGIVAGTFDTLNIADVIDRVLTKRGSRNLPHSVIIKAMILNGLGFTGQRLYLFPNFFKTIPTEKLTSMMMSLAGHSMRYTNTVLPSFSMRYLCTS
jgi:hypothetical protein